MSWRGQKLSVMNVTFPEAVALLVLLMLFQVVMIAYILRRREQDTIRKLEHQITALEGKVTLLETAHMDSPLPMWMKDTNGVMRAFNRAYEEAFLIPRGYSERDYLHQFDDAVWPAEIAKEYRANDLFVINTGRTIDTTETVVDHQDKHTDIRIIKWPRKVGTVVIGIAGIAIIDVR